MVDQSSDATAMRWMRPGTFASAGPLQYKNFMESVFLAYGRELIDAARRGPVITPNERLAREITRELQATPELAGRPVVCTSWRGWLTRLYSTLNRRHDQPRLLSTAGFRLRITELGEAGADNQSALIEDAWTLCHQYHLQPTAHSSAGEQFRRWYLELGERLRATGCITPAELEQVLAPLPPPATTVTLAGFDDLNPAQHRLLSLWQSRGMTWQRLDTPRVDQDSAIRLEVPTAADEIRLAAWWAHGILTSSPSATIGILVPGLESRREAVLRQFAAILDPESGSSSTLVDVAGGTPLDATALWQDASVLLRSLVQPVATTRLLRVLRSVHFTLQDTFAPGNLPALTTLPDLAGSGDHATLRRLVAEFEGNAEGTSLLVHLESIERMLAIAGWEHSGAGSGRFQVQQATARALRTLAAEAAWHAEPCDFNAALDRLASHLGQTVHAPERSPARVRIMGYLETPGLAFTHLWITGTSESSLPGPAHPNPLLSAEAMRIAGVKRMDAASERAFTRQLVNLWRSQSRHLVVSHAALETGEHLSGSLLLRDIPLTDPATLPWSSAPAHAWLQHRREASVPWNDDTVRPMPPGRLRGGTSLLGNQAACSFRAFGCHRLGLTEPDEPHALLDPMERGSLLHAVLETVMRAYPSRDALAGATADDFHTFIQRAFAALPRPLPRGFREAETLRLQNLLAAWQALELARQPFRVLHTEHWAELRLEAWHLNLKFDRIDETPAGPVIIDYKSGAARSFNTLLDQGATADPQLPAYALAMPEAAGIFYLNFADEPAAQGVGHPGLGDTGFGRIRTIDDWDGTRRVWGEALLTLVRAFVNGPVRALPADPRLCDRCHIRPVCRVDVDDDDDADDAGEES